MHFNGLDYALLIVILISVIIGLARGFVREALSLASWIAAFWVALHFMQPIADYFQPHIQTSYIRSGIAFFILFAVTLIVASLLSFVVVQAVHKTGLSGADRALGTVFGLGRGALLVAMLLLIGSFSAFTQTQYWQTSILVPQFQPVVAWLQGMLPIANLKEPTASRG